MSAASQSFAVVIDDESSYLSLLEVILGELLTCQIKTYTCPAAALAEIPTMKVGIIVSDFYMPKMDGVQFLQQVKPIKPDVPCILITGHKELLDRMDLTDLDSLKAILGKPFKIDELAKTMAEHWPEALA
jgi:two-component system, NtrC family, nitrogen regulation response regulator NtrX